MVQERPGNASLKTIAIIAATFSGNCGAEMMLSSFISRVRKAQPQTHFHVFSYYSKADRALVSDHSISIHDGSPLSLIFVILPFSLAAALLRLMGLNSVPEWFPERVRAIAGSGVYVDIAGESFRDGREPFLAFNMLTLWPAFLLKIPVHKQAQAIGPMNRPWTRWAADLTLKACQSVTVRGKISETYARRVCETGKLLRSSCDLGFLHSASDSPQHPSESALVDLEAKLRQARKKKSDVWLTCVPSSISCFHAALRGRNYVKWYSDLVRDLCAQGYNVLLLANAGREGRGHWWYRNHDLPLLKKLQTRLRDLNPDQVVFVHQPLTSAWVRQFIQTTDLVLASRFHAMIAAFMEEVPAIAMSNLHKYQEVLDDFNLGDYCFDEVSGRRRDLMKIIIDKLARAEEARQKIREQMPRIKKSAESSLSLILSHSEDNGWIECGAGSAASAKGGPL